MLPDCDIRNFTADWNSGIYLSALLDYCKPGLMPEWRKLNPRNGYGGNVATRLLAYYTFCLFGWSSFFFSTRSFP